jgi:hypothetical protein
MPIITRSETAMQAAAVRASPRGDPMARTIRLLTVFTPKEDASRFARAVRTPGESTVSSHPFRAGKEPIGEN